MKRALATILFLFGSAGCALTSRGAVLTVRHFAPALPFSGQGHAAASDLARPLVRLGRVRGAPWLRERIAYRTSSFEVGYYDDRAWTERPENYLRSALDRELFERRGFERAIGGPAPTLDVELLGFTELRLPDLHAGRVEVRYRIQNDLAVLDEGTIRVDRPIAGGSFDDVIAAISAALEQVSEEVADRVGAAATR